MGKKNKKEKKGKGKEKTDQKAEKKAEKRSKKALCEKGEDDIEKLIAEFQEQDRKLVSVLEENVDAPPPRCNGSLVSFPEQEKIILFGGEYYTGNKMYVYNDVFVYNTRKQEWTKLTIPNGPPPRSAHQAVVVSQQGGQMWIFGGEFSSHSQAQFYHYKDLWVLHLQKKKWEQVKSPGAPSARSGHRMIALKKQIIVFGGFHDNTRDYKYFNDVHCFNLETYTWSVLTPSGTGPSPRSGCVFLPTDAGKAIVYGGYSKEHLKRDVDKGVTHTDMFVLGLEKKREGDSDQVQKWKWQPLKQSGPSPRSGMTGITGPNDKAYCFGGVFDEEDDDEFLEGKFYNELWMLDLAKHKWFQVELKANVGDKKKRRRKKKDENGVENEDLEQDDEEEEDEEDMDVTEQGVEKLTIDPPEEDSVFKVTIAAPSEQPGTSAEQNMSGCDEVHSVDSFWPSRRMNTAMVIKDGHLFMYGGMFEDDKDRQITLSDMYSLDLQKLNTWNVLIKSDPKLQEWEDSDDEMDKDATATGGHEDDSDSDDSDESMDITFDDAPPRREGESIANYFDRSKDYWISKAKEIYEEEGETISDRRILRFAKEVCEEACA